MHLTMRYEAKIGNVNLVPVSSMLPPNTELVDMPELEPGKMTNCVLSHQYSENQGDEISAVIAYCKTDEMGCVVEICGINRSLNELKDEARFMDEYDVKEGT